MNDQLNPEFIDVTLKHLEDVRKKLRLLICCRECAMCSVCERRRDAFIDDSGCLLTGTNKIVRDCARKIEEVNAVTERQNARDTELAKKEQEMELREMMQRLFSPSNPHLSQHLVETREALVALLNRPEFPPPPPPSSAR
jgi:hypothetical protein